jgi:hypothetical protein
MLLKRIYLFGLILLFLAACGRQLPDADQIQEQVSQVAEAAVEQGAVVATQAAELAAEQGAALATQAAESIVAEGAALATAAAEYTAEDGAAIATQAANVAATAAAELASGGENLAATIAATEFDGSAFAEKFSQIQLSGAGTQEVAISETEMNAALGKALEVAAAAGQAQRVQNPAVRFTNATVVLNAVVVEPNLGVMEIVLQPFVEAGALQFAVVSATVAGISVPPVVLQSAQGIFNLALDTGLSRLPAGVGVQSVTVGEGVMTLVVGSL